MFPQQFASTQILYAEKYWTGTILVNCFKEENGEEYFGDSGDRSSVVLRYLRVLVGKILANCASFTKLSKNFSIQYFPMHVNTNYACFAGILTVS